MAGKMRNRRRRTAPKKSSKFRKAIASANKAVFRKKVLKVLREQVETKQAYHTNNTSGLERFNSGINQLGDKLQLLPSIAKGTNDNQRIGERIRAQSLNIKGYMRFDPNFQVASPSSAVAVRLFVVSIKGKNSLDAVSASAAPLSQLLKKGGSGVAFTGILSDITAPLNTDVFTKHYDRVYYLGQDQINTIGGAPAADYVTNNIRKLIRFFNINVKCRNKDLKYDDSTNSALFPTNFYPIMLVGYSYLDGTSPDVAITRLGVEFTTTFKYEDA